MGPSSFVLGLGSIVNFVCLFFSKFWGKTRCIIGDVKMANAKQILCRTHFRHADVSLCTGEMFDGAFFWRFSAVVQSSPFLSLVSFFFFFLSLSLFDFLISLSPLFPLAAKEGLLVRLPAV